MGFALPDSNDFERPEDGTYLAMCYRIVDLGTQSEVFSGETKLLRKVTISWELPTERMKDGRPFSVNKRYTFSSAENANLRKDLEAWRGAKFTPETMKGFEIDRLLGKPCVVTVSTTTNEKGKTFTNIIAITPPIKGTKIPPETENETFCFAMIPGMFNPALMEKLHEKVQETIRKSPEWQAMSKGGTSSAASSTADELDDELPFNFKDLNLVFRGREDMQDLLGKQAAI
jgi:hypothetical protein